MEQVTGHLEITDRGFGFLRAIENNYRPSPEDVFVHAGLIADHQPAGRRVRQGIGRAGRRPER